MPRLKGVRKPLKRKEVDVVQRIADGLSVPEAAKELGIDPKVVRYLMKREDVQKMLNENIAESMRSVAGRAAKVLSNQLDDPNPWVAQQAARTILQYVGELDHKDAAVIVNFGNMPAPGLPEAEEEEETVDVEGKVE